MPEKVFHSLDLRSRENCEYQVVNNSFPKGDYGLPPFSIMGAGRSIAGSFFGNGTTVLQLSTNSRLIELDVLSQQVRVGASVTVAEVYNFLVSRGFSLNSLPSYPGVTIGGCIAANVHGQHHYREGCFGRNLVSFLLGHPEHGLKKVSPEIDQRLFDLTVGGFGLTGLILEATFRIIPLKTDVLHVSVREFGTILECYKKLLADKDKADFFHSWVDLTNLSNKGERGFLLRGIFDHKSKIGATKVKEEQGEKPHFLWKPKLFSGPALRLINYCYYFSNTHQFRTSKSLAKFIFPSGNRLWYFSMFGMQGIIEHQVLIPHESVVTYLTTLKKILVGKNPFISLCHLKLFAGKKKLLNFDGDGLCLAMHFRADKCSFETLSLLDHINIEHGCITNIIKDSRVPAGVLKRQYRQYDEFLDGILKYDSNRVFQSCISEKLFPF